MRSLSLAVSFAIALGAAACGDPGRDELDTARARWSSAGLTSYSFHYRTTGFVAPVDARITVSAGTVIAVDDLGTSTLPIGAAPTIDALFDQIEHELAAPHTAVTATYDPVLGFPASAYFQGGEGAGFDVSEVARSP